MADQVRFTKDQRAKAKEYGVPLIAICIDDRFRPKGKGRMEVTGPGLDAESKPMWDALLAFCKGMGKRQDKLRKDRVKR